nr:MAG TPA: hypothetical protein [Caudoviricetes sp.]
MRKLVSFFILSPPIKIGDLRSCAGQLHSSTDITKIQESEVSGISHRTIRLIHIMERGD